MIGVADQPFRFRINTNCGLVCPHSSAGFSSRLFWK